MIRKRSSAYKVYHSEDWNNIFLKSRCFKIENHENHHHQIALRNRSQNNQEIQDAQDATARMATTRMVLLRRAIGSCVQSAAKLAQGVFSHWLEMARTRIDRIEIDN